MIDRTPERATARYALCVRASRKVRWDIDRDVLRAREFDFRDRFLPDALTKVAELHFLTAPERRLVSQVQGRSYAYLFGLFARFIGTKMLEQSREHSLGDQVALEALVRFSEEEIKHQELFRRVDTLLARGMQEGYATVTDPNDLAHAVLARSTWAVLALTCHIELIAQSHFEQIIAADPSVSPLFRDVFRHHWQEECQHAIIDELEWRRVHARLDAEARDQGVTDLIELIGIVDAVVLSQAHADANYFLRACDRRFTDSAQRAVRHTFLRAYGWQFIASGVQHPHFSRLITDLTTPAQLERIHSAVRPMIGA